MEDKLVLTSTQLLLGKISSFMENEISLLRGVDDELEEIKLELISMQAFLQDAQIRGTNDIATQKTWVSSVRNLVYDIEDIIEECTYHMHNQHNRGRFTRTFFQIISFPENVWWKHQIATKLKKINRKIKAISERSQRYGIGQLTGLASYDDTQWVKNLAESSLFIDDKEIVGFKGVRAQLMGWLINNEDHQQQQRMVISVVGMGGSGKSTLVANIFNNQIVRQHFECRAWVTISKKYAVEDLFRIMIKEFCKEGSIRVSSNLSNMSYRELVEMLVSYLQEKRYLVVLDDVWNTNAWREINVGLPNGGNGSRIILTTRNEDVACFSCGVKSKIHYMSPLQKDEAWILFCMKTFSSSCCPSELQSVANDLVEKCEGLPLAIVALGGLLSTKKSRAKWIEVHNRLNWELANNSMLVVLKSILLLSFNDLPYSIKQCFLYLSLFPEDWRFRSKWIINFWVAEGFVERIKGSTPKEVGESYLRELIARNMLLVEQNLYIVDYVFRMHDLIREVALLIAESEKFGVIADDRSKAIDEIDGARRMSIQFGNEIKSDKRSSQLRSLLIMGGVISKFTLEKLTSQCKFLRVLYVRNASFKKVANEIAQLFNLRYLGFRNTPLRQLPTTIGKLVHLETLYLVNTQIEELPKEIDKLENLRHLVTYRSQSTYMHGFQVYVGTRVHGDIDKLKMLQTLSEVVLESNTMKQLKCMTQLRATSLRSIKEADGEEMCLALEKMALLRSLTLSTQNGEDWLAVQTISSPPPNLEYLVLTGRLEKVPSWFMSLQNVCLMELINSSLSEDVIPHIQNLPKLNTLILTYAYEGDRLVFDQGFLQLQQLLLRSRQLREIVIEKGVMPGLQQLKLADCKKLKALPRGIEHLTRLQRLILLDISNKLLHGIKEKGSVEYTRISHILDIKHYIYLESAGSFQVENII